MGRKANPTVIGAFIVGAVVLIVAALMVFGSGQLFTQKNTFVLYFDGSVNGLNVGAPVKFRGVRVGAVTQVRALYNPKDYTGLIQVVAEVEPAQFTQIIDGVIVSEAARQRADTQALIAAGLRAQLQVESMVTGLLYVELAFLPDTPVNLVGIPSEYSELPTIPTTMEELFAAVRQIMDELGALPVTEALNELTGLLQRVNSILTSPKMDAALADVGSILNNVDKAVAESLADLPALVDKAGGTADAATAALQATRQLVQDIDSQVDPLAGGAQATLRSARNTLQQGSKTLVTLEQAVKPAIGEAEQALASVRDLVRPDSVVVNDLSKTLVALERAAQSIRILANYLERNPEALLRGKGRAGGR